MMFPKPQKNQKEKKTYNSLQQRQTKRKKEIAPWRKDILSSHQHKPSRADRADFPAQVISELIAETEGKCQCGCGRTATQTHHVMPRGRSGRGVKTNAMRVCDICHDRIQTNEDELQQWINFYSLRFGPRFWYDDQDWEEFNRKQVALKAAEDEKKEWLDQIKPVVELITTAAGRSLKAKELRLLEGFDEREMAVFTSMLSDVVAAAGQSSIKPSYAYGERFED